MTKAKENQKNFYIEEVGRRKTAVARVRIYPNNKTAAILVNEKDLKTYFPTFELQETVLSPLKATGYDNSFKITVLVKGGGIVSQSQAVRHGIARCLVKLNPDLRKQLKDLGYLKRDPRMRERKKFGLKRARRAPQWQKR